MIVAGALAPHPPHLVYAENPPQNEPRSEGGWETLRWGYEKLRASLALKNYDVLVVLSPHWRTYVGHHILGVPSFDSLSVDPIFPNLFRYHYKLKVDVKLGEEICAQGQQHGLQMQMMRNPDFRIDYGTIVSCHMINPLWDKPIVAISSTASTSYFNMDYTQREMFKLGEATKKAIEKSGKRAVLVASNSLSHRHFTTESEVPEDMSKEHITNHNQYLWDMRMISLMKAGKSEEIINVLPDFTEQTMAETEAGALTWMLAALDFPQYPAQVHAYGTVIGTGNVIAEWDNELAKDRARGGAKK